MGRSSVTVLACVVALLEATGEQASAAQKKPKEPAPPVVSSAAPKPSPEPAQKPVRSQGKKAVTSVTPERQPDVVQKQGKQTLSESKSVAQKGHRQVKVHKRTTPKAVVQPRQDLMHHGLLEDAQRYDPRPNHRTAGVQNPQTPDLTHDHFQELDRNQDGRIDPVERTFGRLDMDRDLHNRQPQ